MQLRAGTVLDGRYEVVGPLGRGGMASVWRVRHTTLCTDHALKVLAVPHELLAARMAREGRFQGRIDHPNVVPVTDLLDLDGVPALVVAFVDGPTLGDIVRGGPHPEARVDALVAGLVAGVQAAHDAGVIHRDLKPENVLVAVGAGAETVRIADFGLAKLLDPELDTEWKGTRPGIAIGTPQYMAPEQVRDARSVGPAADIWALGCILYELATGTLAFPNEDAAEALKAVLSGSYQPPRELAPDLPERWERAIVAALRMSPAARPSSAALLGELWSGERAEESAPATMGILAEHMLPVRHNLPRDPGAFVGRQAELGMLEERVHPGSIVTVLGPGGAGKTRLTLQLVRRRLSAWPGGVFFCDLSDVHDHSGLTHIVARAMDLKLGTGDPVEQLGFALNARGRALVLLDNFEQCVDIARDTVARWSARCEEGAFLITSRVPLGLDREQVVRLGPMDVPQIGASVADVRSSEAVQMLTSRVGGRGGRLSVGPDNSQVIADLVRLLDGLPLALELAARRIGFMSPQMVLDRLRDRFGLLRASSGPHTDRHASLRSAIDVSWDLLEPAEKDVFGQLSVFRGGFTLAAAQAVVAPSEAQAAMTVEDVVERLYDCSLLVSWAPRRLDGTIHDGERRYGMLVSLHEYASEKLDAGARDAAWLRHGTYFATGFTPDTEQAVWDLENLLVAFERALPDRSDVLAPCAIGAKLAYRAHGPLSAAVSVLERGLDALGHHGQAAAQMLADLCQLHTLTGDPGDAVQAGRAALEAVDEALHDGVQVRARTRMGRALELQGKLDEARHAYVAAVEQGRRLGDSLSLVEALTNLGGSHRRGGRLDESQACYAEALQLATEADERGLVAMMVANLGRVLHDRGRDEEAEEKYTRALSVLRELGDTPNESAVLNSLGLMAVGRGDLKKGRARLESAAALDRALGIRTHMAHRLVNLGTTYQIEGRFDEARDLFRQAVALGEEITDPLSVATAKANLGIIAGSEGDHEAATVHLEASVRTYTELQRPYLEAGARAHLGFHLVFLGRMDDAEMQYMLALKTQREVGSRRAEGSLLGSLGSLELLRGRPDQAEGLCLEALAIHREVDNPRHEAMVQGTLGCASLARSAWDEAERQFDGEWVVAERLHRAVLQLEVHLGRHLVRAGRALAEGELEAARHRVGLARQVADDLGEELRLEFATQLSSLADAVAAASQV